MRNLYYLLLLLPLMSWASVPLFYEKFDLSAANLRHSSQISQIFSSLGFHTLARPEHGIPSLGINQVYFKDEQQFVMVKYGLKGNFPLNELMRMPQGFIVHKEVEGEKIFFYFRGFNQATINLMLAKLERKVTYGPFQKFRGLLLSEAHAADPDCDILGGPIMNQAREMAEISASVAVSMLRSCVTAMGTGAWDSTVGVAQSIGSGIYTLATDFTNTIESMANKVSHFISATSRFMSGLVTFPKATLAKMGTGLGTVWDKATDVVTQMSTEMKVQFACSLLGAIGIDAAIAFFTVGAGSPKLALTLTNLANKLSKMGRLVHLLSKLSASTKVAYKLSDEKMQKLMDKVMRNQIKDDDLSSLDNTAAHSPEVSLGTLSCYIR